MVDKVIGELRSQFDETIKGLGRELNKLRTGRANISMLDGVRVEYYGQTTPLNQVGTLKVADARMITVSPWDKSLLGAIERAITVADLGLNPSNDGVVVRIPIPALTGERRQELVKRARRIGEDHKVSIRNARREANDQLKEFEKESEITEDDLHKSLARVNQITDEFIKRVEESIADKETDILEV